jgi:flagellar biosynthetic protein FlhB
MAEDAGEKSQDATQHRRDEARKQGQVPQSQDLGSATLLVCGIIVLLMSGPPVVVYFIKILREQLGGEPWLAADPNFLLGEWNRTSMDLATVLLPILGLMMLFGILVNLFQVGFLFLPEKLAPDLGKLSIFKGFGRLFSLASTMRMMFGLFKMAIVTTVAFSSLIARREELLALTSLDVAQIALYTTEIVLWTCLKIGIALLILAILDYGYQRWKHNQDLMMTQQEVREEMKNLQGDPQIISRRRMVQRQMALNRMGQSVPKADVVITNPTELAIAIQYNPQEMAAPIVVAKGAGVLAQRIRRLALENNIPIIEKKPLAQQLYKEVDVNHPIPHELYGAVAEVLAYVYQLKGKTIPGAPAA